VSADGGGWVIITNRAALNAQALAALDAIESANGGTLPATLREAYDVDREAFASLIEALANLGADIDPEMTALAGLRPIAEWLP
jgi:hypothetical protein